MRYKLRTLLIALALGPPVLAGAWWFVNSGAMAVVVYEVPYWRNLWGKCCRDLGKVLPGLVCVCGAVVFIAYVASRVAAGVTKK